MVDFFKNIVDGFVANPLVSILDILMFAVLLYVVFMVLKKNNAVRLILFIIPAILLAAVLSSPVLGFPIMGRIFSFALLFALLAVIILFPAETRRWLWRLSSSAEMQSTFNAKYDVSDEELKDAVDQIVRAAQNMAKKNTGALIIVAPENLPIHILESGTGIDGKVTNTLLETVFHNKTPLHDGAVVIRGNRIVAAGCFLPLSQDKAIDKELGTRHRAAIGVTETYHVFTIIVSEETGVISTAKNGVLTRYYDSVMLTDELLQVYGLKAAAKAPSRKRRW